MIEDAVLIAGPTASGKSAAALALARREDRTVVNADSMQVYAGLRILSAAPDDQEIAAAPHRLYGHVDPRRDHSVGAWLRDVAQLEADGAFAARPPVFVGGTGLYFKALLDGLPEMPAIPSEIRDAWRGRLRAEGAEALHRELRLRDPVAAGKLALTDGQRLVRALEVIDATGRSLLFWQGRTGRPIVNRATARCLLLQPERARLVERIDARFDRMLEAGALDEARRIGMLNLAPDLPAAKAIGLRELLAFQRGQTTLAVAAATAKAASRQYAKRQTTWFRHQCGPEWRRLPEWDGAL